MVAPQKSCWQVRERAEERDGFLPSLAWDGHSRLKQQDPLERSWRSELFGFSNNPERSCKLRGKVSSSSQKEAWLSQ